LTASYALTHPENLEKAILADPWGMKERPTDIVQVRLLELAVLSHYPLGLFIINKNKYQRVHMYVHKKDQN